MPTDPPASPESLVVRRSAAGERRPLSLFLPQRIPEGLWRERVLVRRLIGRELGSRTRGSVLGLAWMVLQPLLLLAVFTLVFGTVFQARWQGAAGASFPLMLFSGLIVYLFASDVLVRSPGLVLENPSYVTKVVFPLEVLSAVAVGAGLVGLALSAIVLVAVRWVVMGPPPMTVLLLPLVVCPLVLMLLGVSWFLAALGVYLRDLRHVVAPMVQVLMFLSPVFFPIAALPAGWQAVALANPLTVPIEGVRAILLDGLPPDWAAWAWHSLAALAVAALGHAWFVKLRKGFADVL
ncbi:ABC transporter permease [Zavarzinia sp. CC-PAN008]|uniref:ABC transporter permease n=1 Tax=Zavarzinia sp. CC-PAN008 TaxID=3243332 RepID=UPI003F744218